MRGRTVFSHLLLGLDISDSIAFFFKLEVGKEKEKFISFSEQKNNANVISALSFSFVCG